MCNQSFDNWVNYEVAELDHAPTSHVCLYKHIVNLIAKTNFLFCQEKATGQKQASKTMKKNPLRQKTWSYGTFHDEMTITKFM